MKSNKLILQILFVFATLCLQATTISPYINLGELGKYSQIPSYYNLDSAMNPFQTVAFHIGIELIW